MEIVFFIILFLMVFLFWYAKTNGLDNGLYLLHRKAYKQYQKEVLEEGKSYQRYMVDFYNENVFLSVANDNRAIARLNERNKNFHILIELLQTRRDLVTHYFGLEHFTLEDFKVLNKEFNTSCSCVESDQHLEIKNLSVECSQEIKKSGDKEIKEKLAKKVLKQNIEQSHLELLTKAMKELEIFDGDISETKIFQFFTCSLEKPLAVSKGKRELLASLLSSLHSKHFKYIHPHWQKICGEEKLLVSDSGKLISSSNLSSAVSYNSLSEKEGLKIKCYIDELKKLQE